MENQELRHRIHDTLNGVQQQHNLQKVLKYALRLEKDEQENQGLEDLTPAEMAQLKKGLAQAKRGETIPHATVMAELHERFPQMFTDSLDRRSPGQSD